MEVKMNSNTFGAELENNKKVVQLFNLEVIEKGNSEIIHEIIDPAFVNRTAAPGTDAGIGGMLNTFNNILRPALKDMKVKIHEQVAEKDLVTTRKTISGLHVGPLAEAPPTGNVVEIDVIDIVRLKNGRYLEHWGLNTFQQVISKLK